MASDSGEVQRIDVKEAIAIKNSVMIVESAFGQLPDCKIILESVDDTIEVAWVSRIDPKRPYQVGSRDGKCGYTHIFDRKTDALIRKVFHR